MKSCCYVRKNEVTNVNSKPNKKYVKELIERGDRIEKEEIHHSQVGLGSHFEGPQYEKWISDIRIFNERYLKSHPLYESIRNIKNTHRGYSQLIGNLRALLDDDEFWQEIESKDKENNNNIGECLQEKIIFLSHKSDDKKYGDALRDFIIGLGVKDEQLIYTSHPLNKIPIDENIYEYLRKHINSQVFMIILWSDKYLESPACLNEMGAAWVTQADYTNIYVPDFSFGNPKYHECAVDTRKMGAVLNGDAHCKTSMIELKNKIVNIFELTLNEEKTSYLIDEFMKKIKA